MHRFRKKSDARRIELPPSSPGFGASPASRSLPPLPIVTQHIQVYPPPDPPSLPPVSDFRTSLILPDLTKRFTLLRSSSGAPVSLDDLRSRFAEQRAKGAENQISEEEEDMLLDMLSRIRAHGGGLGGTASKSSVASESINSSVRSDPSSASISSNDAGSSTSSTVRQSTQSSTTTSTSSGHDSSLSPVSPSSRSSRRHSNNLFAAGQLRDMRYMRKSSNRTISSSRSAMSSTPSESTTENIANALIDSYSEGNLRPMTPENTTPTASPSSSPISVTAARSINLSHSSSMEDSLGPLPGSANLRLSRQLTNGQLQRMSMSLEEAIKRIEEEADDQILVPRSATFMQSNGNTPALDRDRALALTTDDNNSSPSNVITEASNGDSTMSWFSNTDASGSAAVYRSPSPYRAGGSTSPVPRVPGYIPGMPRPVTPARDMDMEDVRSLSTTPRAASSPSTHERSAASPQPISVSPSTVHRPTVNASPTPYGARPKSPHSSVKDRQRNSANGVEHTPLGSHWRRPSSPLSNNTGVFQSLNGGSRPSTPSNVTWNVSGRESGQVSRPLGRNGTLLGHSRNASNSSVDDGQSWVESSNDDPSKDVLRSPNPIYAPAPATPEDKRHMETRNKFMSNGSVLTTSALGFVGYDPASDPSSFRGNASSPNHDHSRSISATSTIDDKPFNKQRILSPLLTPPTSPFASHFHNNPLFISRNSNNSSRSSLVSIGSSYHSRDEDDGGKFISAPDRAEPAWHEITIANQTDRSGNRNHMGGDDPESILRQYTGLSKLDLLAIQGKLLETAEVRSKNPEVRAPSTLRRRRPSTAQSIHSIGGQQSRTTSPALIYGPPWTSNTDSTAKANALLNSVVDSIGPVDSQEHDGNEGETAEEEALPPPPRLLAPIPTSSPGRRNKDLAEILFGPAEAEPVPALPVESTTTSPNGHIQNAEEEQQGFNDHQYLSPPPRTDETTPNQSTSDHGFNLSLNNVSSPDPTDLIRQVQERTEAAMAQLRRSPQQGRFPISGQHATKKKIHLQDISAPLLVQSSTSIDKLPTIPTSPLKPAQNDVQRTIKMSLSKRLRNTLRNKNPQPNGEEVTPWTLDNTSSSFTSSPQVGNRSLTPSKSSVTDLNAQPRAPNSNVSPPASAGPNLKSFMSRFRKKGQAGPLAENEQKISSSSFASSNGMLQSAPANGRLSFQLQPSSTPLLSRSGSVSQAVARHVVTAPSLSRQPTERPSVIPPSSPPASPPSDPMALKQFYEAAQNLGLDQSALNDFLARSQRPIGKGTESSISAMLSRSDSSADKPLMDTPRAHSPVIPEVFIEQPVTDLSRNTSLRQRAGSPVLPTPRRVREIADVHGNVRNTIVRRTLIFPSANGSSTDIASLSRKVTTKNYKRASNLSMQSNRSVHERIPTPPPSKAKRQSIDPSPPVPSLPSPLSLSTSGRLSTSRLTPETPMEKSPYDSLYDMYVGDRTGSVQSPEPFEPSKSSLDEGFPEMEEGQALEVLELANGETIWSIVNGLRAEDAESVYQRRGSFDSEYSTLPAQDSEVEQLFFKEHARTGSKGSNISNLMRRKSQATARPETKVFHSSSAHIARLIEQLAHSTEAATFNIKPKDSHVPGHSHSGSLQTDSDINWTVEERLERMLDSVKALG